MRLFAAGQLFRVRSRGTESGAEMDAPASEEAPDQAAQFIASLTQELAEIARRNGLDTLILEMARLEADQLIKR